MSRCEHIWIGDEDERMICECCGEMSEMLPFMLFEDDAERSKDLYWDFRGSR